MADMKIHNDFATAVSLRALRSGADAASVAVERLSSGLRINRAADDPTGLTISKTMASKARGLQASLTNLQDASNMVRTMESGLSAIQNILFRIRDLSVRAANEAVVTSADKTKMQSEVDSLVSEIDRTAASISYNNKLVLSGGGASPEEDRVMVRARPAGSTDYDLYTMKKDGSDLTVIQDTTGDERHVAWSADGSKMAYASDTGSAGSFDIYTADADGQNPVKITTVAGMDDRVPRWSPDGTKIAFYSRVGAGSNDVYVINADGTGLVQLTNTAGNDTEPRWSPDGTKLIFSSFRTGDSEVFVMNADGSGQVNVSNHAGASDSFCTFSPDGTQITFASDFDGDYDIYIANIDGSNLRNLTNSPGKEDVYHWSPDGTKIIYNSTPVGGRTEIYSMDVDGGNQTNLTNLPNKNDLLLWNVYPFVDDNTIGFDTDRTGPETAYLMDLDGSNQRGFGGGLSTSQLIGTVPPSQANPQSIQVGPDNAEHSAIEMNFPTITAGYLQIDSINLSTASLAGRAIDSTDTAIATISTLRSQLGSIEKRLQSIARDNSMELINTSAARSNIEDADMAAETTAMTKEMILQNTAASALSHSNASVENALSLITNTMDSLKR